MNRGPLLIIGASGRAAAASAIRAGYQPYIIDLFADADTRQLGPAIAIRSLHDSSHILEIVRQYPHMPWFYTGGLEKHLDLVSAISEIHELIGNSPAIVETLIHPFQSLQLLERYNIHTPRRSLNDPCQAGWLQKTIRRSGGRNVRWAHQAEHQDISNYFEEYIPGPVYSTIFTAFDDDSQLGVCQVLQSIEWLHAGEFAYCGNIGPFISDLTINLKGIALELKLQGINGVDFVIGPDRRAYVIDINPRYTASVELYEISRGISLLNRHMPGNPRGPIGKAIYYAAHDFHFPSDGPWINALNSCTRVWQLPEYADIPNPGSKICKGQPVMTLLVESSTGDRCLDLLKLRAMELDRVFGVDA